MKKVLFGLLMLVSVGAFAADATLALGTVHNRVSGADGSYARLAVQNDSVAYGVQAETVANVSRNQADVTYSLVDVAGMSASVGLGAVTKTNVKTHAVYLANVGYKYKFSNGIMANVGMSYRNDFESAILDRKTTASIGAGYMVTENTKVGVNYARGYGDSKTNIYTLACNTKF